MENYGGVNLPWRIIEKNSSVPKEIPTKSSTTEKSTIEHVQCRNRHINASAPFASLTQWTDQKCMQKGKRPKRITRKRNSGTTDDRPSI